jgi:hypothetical protein
VAAGNGLATATAAVVSRPVSITATASNRSGAARLIMFICRDLRSYVLKARSSDESA